MLSATSLISLNMLFYSFEDSEFSKWVTTGSLKNYKKVRLCHVIYLFVPLSCQLKYELGEKIEFHVRLLVLSGKALHLKVVF